MKRLKNQAVVAAFSEEQTERLTGVSKAQLRYWDRTSFYSPSYAEEKRRVAFSRIYSFKDIVALRVLNQLRNCWHVSLPHLRDTRRRLVGGTDPDRWTGVRLYVLNKRVVWHEPGTELPQDVASQQYVVRSVELRAVLADARREVANLSARSAEQIGHVERSRFVNHNTPVLAGTRIPVHAIKRFAEAGYSTAGILKEYPDLSEKDVEAAIAYEYRSVAA